MGRSKQNTTITLSKTHRAMLASIADELGVTASKTIRILIEERYGKDFKCQTLPKFQLLAEMNTRLTRIASSLAKLERHDYLTVDDAVLLHRQLDALEKFQDEFAEEFTLRRTIREARHEGGNQNGDH